MKTNDELRQPREALSHVAIPGTSPIATPSKSLTTKEGEADAIKAVQVDSFDRMLPAIRIQHPSPELRESAFEKEIPNVTRNSERFGQIWT